MSGLRLGAGASGCTSGREPLVIAPGAEEHLVEEGGEGEPELAGGDGVDDGVHQAVGQLGEHDVVAQLHVDPGVGATHAAK